MRKIFAVTLLASVAACGEPTLDESAGSAQTYKLETFCTVAGLEPAIRETVFVIDASAFKDAAPETVRAKNAALFEAAAGLADAERAISSGVMAPRERLTIAVADAQTGGLTEIFTGCLPALSQEELAKRAAEGEDSALGAYFGSDMASQLEETRRDFATKVLLTISQVKTTSRKAGGEDFNSSSFAKIFRIIGPGAAEKGKIRRLVIFSDPGAALGAISEVYTDARISGFALAQTAQTDLGMSELYLIPADRSVSDAQRGFLDAWLLGTGADLRHVGAFTPSAFAKAPAQIVTYSGELPLSSEVTSPMELRLPAAVDGTLSGAWISYTASKGVRRTPITGQFVCTADGCDLRGDPDGGLGQRWRTLPGADPQPLVDGPFGGMRLVSGTDNGDVMKGRIHDPIIYVGDTGDLKFTVKRSH